MKTVLEEMINKPYKGDWILVVKEDLKELQINLSFEEIASISKKRFKEIVRNACKQACFLSLLSDKNKLSKGKEIEYSEFKTQKYLLPGTKMSTESIRWIFAIRSRDLPIRGNFPGAQSDNKCAIEQCPEQMESQYHLFVCPFLSSNNEIVSSDISYNDIFKNNVEKQHGVMKIMQSRYNRRRELMTASC